MTSARPTSRSRRLVMNGLVLVGSLVLALLVAEGVLRIFFPAPSTSAHYIWPPHFRASFAPRAEIMPGVSGRSDLIVNADGIRGDALRADQGYRILALGGSTTECLYLDQAEAWPQLLQGALDALRPDLGVWVGNAGRSGTTSREHVYQVAHLLTELPPIDVLVVLMGVNDLDRRLQADVSFEPWTWGARDDDRYYLERAFALLPPEEHDLLGSYRHTTLYGFVRNVRQRLRAFREGQDRDGTIYAEWREHRRRATAIRTELPDLGPALAEYARNIETLIDRAAERSVRIVFLTQPTLWYPGMPAELEDLLWVGRVGRDRLPEGQEYYSHEALSVAMAGYNATLVEVCRARGVEYLDLAALLPKDTSVFYDDDHFNEAGARQVASLLAAHFADQAPFGDAAGDR